MPRYSSDSPAIYFEVLTCGAVPQQRKRLNPKDPVHTPNNCSNCKQGISIVEPNSYIAVCNQDKCIFETQPNNLTVVTELIKEHAEENHKPKKGRPKST